MVGRRSGSGGRGGLSFGMMPLGLDTQFGSLPERQRGMLFEAHVLLDMQVDLEV